MTFPQNDDFTRNLNDRIKELEDMTNEIDDQTTELEDQATKLEDRTTELDDEATKLDDQASETSAVNQSKDARTDGDTIFFTASIDTSAPVVLNVVNNNGDLEVFGTDSGHIEISATRSSGEDVDHDHWFFQQVDNEITLRPNWQVGSHVGDIANKIKTQLKEGFKTSDWSTKDFKFGLDVNYDIVVRMPKNLVDGSRLALKTANGDGQAQDIRAKVDFKTANGDLDVSNITGPLTINSANGDLNASGITGNTHASTANGDVVLNGITGSVEANAANGDVHVENATGWIVARSANGDVRASNVTSLGGRFGTVAGDISVDAVLTNATSYTFDTVTGDVHVDVRVPAQGATLNAKTVSGKVITTGEWQKQGKRDWVLGEGNGPQLSAKSVSSNITINTVVDPTLTLLHEEPSSESHQESGAASHSKNDGDVNINLDIEIERAKGWLKDIGTKLGSFLGEGAPEAPVAPPAPEAPMAPEAPKSPEQVASTNERRTKLLEAVKNGEMTIDEALAELERDA